MFLKRAVDAYLKIGLVPLIITGLILGVVLATVAPSAAESVGILGEIFVGALKGVAPILVFILIINAIAQHQHNTKIYIKPVIVLYIIGTFLAAVVGVLVSFLFPTTLALVVKDVGAAPSSIFQVLHTLVINMVDNPIKAIYNANYIGILAWAILLGIFMRHANQSTKVFLNDISDSVTKVVTFVIRLAPFGVFGIVASTIVVTGFGELYNYLRIIMVLVGGMLFVALVVNPLIVFFYIRRNPYPLVFTCLMQSGITAFFTRSSAANIPVNMNLAKKLGLHEDTYSVTIPLGATINMAGAAVTITVLTLAATFTLNIQVDIPTAILLSFIATIGACGASGVPGGSLLLIPMACSLFGISNDIATQVVAVGFIIGVVQDSCETALNSSTDVLFTAAADDLVHSKQL